MAKKAPHVVPFLSGIAAAKIVHFVEPAPELVDQVARIVVVKDAPIVAGAIAGEAAFRATYDRKHLLRRAPVILAEYRITVALPEQILSSI